MREAWAILGVGFAILFAGLFFVNPNFTTPAYTDNQGHEPYPQPMPESTLSLVSAAFANNATLPALYTCDGEGISPPLSIAGVPLGAKSLAIILEDPDVPRQLKPDGLFVHWVLFNIPATTTGIAQGEAPGATGLNSAGKPGYYPPCPPAQYEPSTHRYIFHLYALDSMLDLNAASATRDALLRALQGHILAQAELVGKYGR